MSTINIVLSDQFFKKDPQSSELGRRIVTEGLISMHELGFEEFTFKKLAARIDSSEASIYRYFKNKHKFLVYLSTYYWAWLEYLIEFETHHLSDPEQKLATIIDILCHVRAFPKILDIPDLDMTKLRNVIDIESDKTYLNKDVDSINEKGLFRGYKSLCSKISGVIALINPAFQYPRASVSMMMEAAHQQPFFAQHLPSLTEISKDKKVTLEQQTADYLKFMMMTVIK